MYETPERKSAGRISPLPHQLRSNFESMTGAELGDVRVHHESPLPAQVGALAFTQGKNIHLAPGQDRHLAHETAHVVQQMSGRVAATTSVAGVAVNDQQHLEHEADELGHRASTGGTPHTLQRMTDGHDDEELKKLGK